MSNSPITKSKPFFRGHIHQVAFFVSFGACLLLVAKSSNLEAVVVSSVYSLGLLLMFGVSALYHRIHWEPQARALMKRLDHSAIFVMIAGTMTPISFLALPKGQGLQLLVISWVIAIIGILQSTFWVKAPKYVTALVYVIMGWLALPFLSELNQSLGGVNVNLLLIGGVIYTLGAISYATKRPKLKPLVFGYHEFFHALTIAAAICHFIVIYTLIQ